MARSDGDGESVEVEDARTAVRSTVRDCNRMLFDVTVGDNAVLGSGKVATVKAVRTDPVEIDIARLDWSATITSGWWQCSNCGRLSVEPSRGGSRRCSVCVQEREAERRRRRREEHEQELRNALMKDPDDVMMRSQYDDYDGGDE